MEPRLPNKDSNGSVEKTDLIVGVLQHSIANLSDLAGGFGPSLKLFWTLNEKKYIKKTAIECGKSVKYIYWVKKDLYETGLKEGGGI